MAPWQEYNSQLVRADRAVAGPSDCNQEAGEHIVGQVFNISLRLSDSSQPEVWLVLV